MRNDKHDVTLIGPAKVAGKIEKAGAQVSVTATELRHLVDGGALPESALDALTGETNAALVGSTSNLAAVTASLADAEKKADDLQSLNEGLVKANEALKADVAAATAEIEELKSANDDLAVKLKEQRESCDKLADELANADLVIAELKGEATKADPEPAASKPAAKTTKKVAGGTAQKG